MRAIMWRPQRNPCLPVVYNPFARWHRCHLPTSADGHLVRTQRYSRGCQLGEELQVPNFRRTRTTRYDVRCVSLKPAL
jgi:hypothetical protein